MGDVLVPEKVNFERKTRHDFVKPINLVAKELEGIIAKLLKLADSEDEKIALQAMSKLLDYHKTMVEAKDKDELQRKFAQLKFGGPQNLVPEKDALPSVDFTRIQEV